MRPALHFRFCLAAVSGALIAAGAGRPPIHRPLTWDAPAKSYETKPGELQAHFTFTATNHTGLPVRITAIHPSCGCTEVRSPPLPWTLLPESSGSIEATIDLAGKRGELTKTLRIYSSAGDLELEMRVRIAASAAAEGHGAVSR